MSYLCIQCCIQIFKDRGHVVDLKKTMPESELIRIIGEYDGLVVRSATKVIIITTQIETQFYFFYCVDQVTLPILKAAKRMSIVGRAGVGIDNIDVSEATK